MAGAALMPKYYTEKMLVSIFLAPPSTLQKNSNDLLKLLSFKENRILLEGVLDTIHLWNVLPYNYLDSGVATAVCHLFEGKFCAFYLSLFTDGDPSADDFSRRDVYMSNLPAGNSYRCLVHYA